MDDHIRIVVTDELGQIRGTCPVLMVPFFQPKNVEIDVVLHEV